MAMLRVVSRQRASRMLLHFAPFCFSRRTAQSRASRSVAFSAEVFESRQVLSASATSVMSVDAFDSWQDSDWSDCSIDSDDSADFAAADESELSDDESDWYYGDDVGDEACSDDEFAAADFFSDESSYAVDPLTDDLGCDAESSGADASDATSDSSLAATDSMSDVLEYVMTTPDDVELYSAEIVALTGNVDEVATDEFLFELDDYLMQRFSAGNDFALESDVVEFYVVDASTLQDMNGDATVDSADWLAAADAYGLTGYDSAYDFLVVRNATGFEVVDIPVSVSTAYSNTVGLDDSQFVPDTLPSGGGFDEFADAINSEFSGSSDVFSTDFTATEDTSLSDESSLADVGSSSDSLSGTSSLETVITTDLSTSGVTSGTSLTSFGTQLQDAFRDAAGLEGFIARGWSTDLSELADSQLALVSNESQSPAMAELVALLVREQQSAAAATGFAGATTRSQTSDGVSVGQDDWWSRAKSNSGMSASDRATFAEAGTRFEFSYSESAADLVAHTQQREIDLAFVDERADVMARLNNEKVASSESQYESLSYSQMASATGVLLIAGSGCVQVSRRNGWWLMWRGLRHAVLSVLRLI